MRKIILMWLRLLGYGGLTPPIGEGWAPGQATCRVNSSKDMNE